jgi:hypothetical protein
VKKSKFSCAAITWTGSADFTTRACRAAAFAANVAARCFSCHWISFGDKSLPLAFDLNDGSFALAGMARAFELVKNPLPVPGTVTQTDDGPARGPEQR